MRKKQASLRQYILHLHMSAAHHPTTLKTSETLRNQTQQANGGRVPGSGRNFTNIQMNPDKSHNFSVLNEEKIYFVHVHSGRESQKFWHFSSSKALLCAGPMVPSSLEFVEKIFPYWAPNLAPLLCRWSLVHLLAPSWVCMLRTQHLHSSIVGGTILCIYGMLQRLIANMSFAVLTSIMLSVVMMCSHAWAP